MNALFHAKSRTCINRFIKASHLGGPPNKRDALILCDARRFAAGREAADAYFKAQPKCPVQRRQAKIDSILRRMSKQERAALAVAEVALASAMDSSQLDKVAQGHIEAAQKHVEARQWTRAEQELQVVEALYAHAPQGVLPDAAMAAGVQGVRDEAACSRFDDALILSRKACAEQRFGTAYTTLHVLLRELPAAARLLSAEGRERLLRIRQEAQDLLLVAELGDDQAEQDAALALMVQGDSQGARRRLRALESRMNARPIGHPSRSEVSQVRRSLLLCDKAQAIDADCDRLVDAEEKGDLRLVHSLSTTLHRELQRLPSDLPCRTAPGLLLGLRSFAPHVSLLPALATMLEDARRQPKVPNRNGVEEAIRALACLEGPAQRFQVLAGGRALEMQNGISTYAHDSMKARIAAEAPKLPPNTLITLHMGPHRMYLHSVNYKNGLGEIVSHAPRTFVEFYQRAHSAKERAEFFDALGFTCVEAQITALQQAHTDPLQEDFVGKTTPKQKCDEYLRVFHLKQIRAYAAAHGLNPVGHADDIDQRKDFEAEYFNSRTFVGYLQAKGFAQSVSAAELKELIDYEINTVGVLSS